MAALTKLRTRLFVWFLVAILVAAATSALAVVVGRGEAPAGPGQVLARGMAVKLSRIWDDHAACERYLAVMRESTGFDFRLRRDVHALPRPVQRAPRKPLGLLAFDRELGAFIPIVRDGDLVGAVQFQPEGPVEAWPLLAALAAAALVLAFAAERLSRELARPLERVADAAGRFGAGDLGARVGRGGIGGAIELRELARAFDGMAERVETVVRDQRELLGAISHELRSPLGRARIALEIASERAEGAQVLEVRRPLADVDTELGEVEAILTDLLAVARAGLSDVRPEPALFLTWLRARLAAEGGELELLVDGDEASIGSLRVALDGALLGRALHNLVANARAHGHPPAEPLEVHLEAREGRVVVEVRDRGPGISDHLLPRIFEPFVRGDAARSPAAEGKGAARSGLGLALVRRIVEAHGGSAFARGRDGGGAVVGFDLPIAT